MRRIESEFDAKEMIDELSKFTRCSHQGSNFCEGCRKTLFTAGKKAERNISSASRATCAIARSRTGAQSAALRNIAIITSKKIYEAIVVRKRYPEVFEENQTEDVRVYNYIHRKRLELAGTINNNWFCEAQRRSEFFPERPQVRPSMTFGNISRKDNAHSSRKNSIKSDSHSPVIFTVQCVCRHPKLIGLSVKGEFEGMITALSVLFSRFKVLPRVCYYENACSILDHISSSYMAQLGLHSCMLQISLPRTHLKLCT